MTTFTTSEPYDIIVIFKYLPYLCQDLLYAFLGGRHYSKMIKFVYSQRQHKEKMCRAEIPRMLCKTCANLCNICHYFPKCADNGPCRSCRCVHQVIQSTGRWGHYHIHSCVITVDIKVNFVNFTITR
jgi:hypothetical protein